MLQREGKPAQVVSSEQPEPDTDSLEYWSTPERQRELRIQWANDPEMHLFVWSEGSQKWLPNLLRNGWIPDFIYRPAPKPLSQEERDAKMWHEWAIENLPKTPEEIWLAGVVHGRSGK